MGEGLASREAVALELVPWRFLTRQRAGSVLGGEARRRWWMKRFLSDFGNRLRSKAQIRRNRYVKRWVEKTQQPEEMKAGEWFGEPLDLNHVPLVGQRNPRGRDGRRL